MPTEVSCYSVEVRYGALNQNYRCFDVLLG